MEIVIERHGGGTATLEEFADKHRLTMKIYERSRVGGLSRFTAHFVGVEIKRNGCLESGYGEGSSPEDAMYDYANRIAGQRLARGAYTSDRADFEAPNEFK